MFVIRGPSSDPSWESAPFLISRRGSVERGGGRGIERGGGAQPGSNSAKMNPPRDVGRGSLVKDGGRYAGHDLVQTLVIIDHRHLTLIILFRFSSLLPSPFPDTFPHHHHRSAYLLPTPSSIPFSPRQASGADFCRLPEPQPIITTIIISLIRIRLPQLHREERRQHRRRLGSTPTRLRRPPSRTTTKARRPHGRRLQQQQQAEHQ